MISPTVKQAGVAALTSVFFSPISQDQQEGSDLVPIWFRFAKYPC